MRQVIELARQGAGFVSPNPMVGCVIVKNGKVLAKGWHKKFGGAHAEIDVIRKLETSHRPGRGPARRRENLKLGGLTVYVNLEPCCHYGKTPPCVDALIVAKPKRVVIGMKDPNPLVAGRGIRRLQAAGIAVAVGVLRKECEVLNETFTKWVTTGRPFVLLKCAVTLDGALSLKEGRQTPLGCTETMRRVHRLRQQYDAIAVGVNTVLIDDPRLTVRFPNRRDAKIYVSTVRNPMRVIFDTRLRIPENALLLRQPGQTIIFTGPRTNRAKKQRLKRKYPNVKISPVRLDRDGHLSLPAAFSWLGENGVASIMVEGGAELANNLLRQKLADKVILILTPHLASDPAAPRLTPSLATPTGVRSRWEWIGSDAWWTIDT